MMVPIHRRRDIMTIQATAGTQTAQLLPAD